MHTWYLSFPKFQTNPQPGRSQWGFSEKNDHPPDVDFWAHTQEPVGRNSARTCRLDTPCPLLSLGSGGVTFDPQTARIGTPQLGTGISIRIIWHDTVTTCGTPARRAMGMDQGRSVYKRNTQGISTSWCDCVWKSMVFSESSWNKSAKTYTSIIYPLVLRINTGKYMSGIQ